MASRKNSDASNNYRCLRSAPKGIKSEKEEEDELRKSTEVAMKFGRKVKRIPITDVNFDSRRRSTSAPDPREISLETRKVIEFSEILSRKLEAGSRDQDSDPLPRRNNATDVNRRSVIVSDLPMTREKKGEEEGEEFIWRIEEEQRKMWREEYKSRVGGMFINNSHAQRLFFKGGKLDDDQLSIICCLADASGDGKLDCEEFVVARFLIHAVESGQKIPTPLPKTLFSDFADSIPSKPELNKQYSYNFVLGETYGRPGTPKIKSPIMKEESEKVEAKEVFSKPALSRVSSLAHFLTHLEEKTSEAKMSNSFENYVKEGNDQVCIERGPLGEIVVTSGTIDGLIKCLASEQHIIYGQEYSEILIFTHPHFTESTEFLNRLASEYKSAFSEEKRNPLEKKIFTIYRLRIINFIRKWIDSARNDFEEGKKLNQTLKLFISHLTQANEEETLQCARILTKSLTPHSIAPALMGDMKSPRKMKLMDANKPCQFMDIPLEELARQMTLYDHELFKSIPISDFLSKRFTDSLPCTLFAKRMEHITYWAASEIVSASVLKDRIMVLVSFIKLMELLLQMRDFYSLMAIYLALSLMAIDRLGKTWKGLPSRHVVVWDKIKTLMDPSNNFMNYRRLWISSELPKIPTPTVFLKDLTFIEEGNPDLNESGMINFNKLVMLGRCIGQLKSSQDSNYQYPIHPRIYKYLSKEMNSMSSVDIVRNSKNCEASKESPSSFRSSLNPLKSSRDSNAQQDRSSIFA
eukprot:TRINITY_DN7069_c0_g1_i1.p1 TRINITY_DN7069_c0_g1~~TRINITY_DN7069_c0_g1_i1.p1  ORF type:complete len:749 (-),score=213.82 TRINITY_DN7069_c0_g1_i1:132-2378(-)